MRYCPDIDCPHHAEFGQPCTFEDTRSLCTECGSRLVQGDGEVPPKLIGRPLPDDTDTVAVFESDEVLRLDQASLMLKEAGIPFINTLETKTRLLMGLFSGNNRLGRLMVLASQAEAARDALAALTDAPQERGMWFCPECGERLEGTFTDCWRCADDGESAEDDEA